MVQMVPSTASTSALGYVLTASTSPVPPLFPCSPWHHTGMLAHHCYSDTPGVSAGPFLAKIPSSDPRETCDKSTAAYSLPCSPVSPGTVGSPEPFTWMSPYLHCTALGPSTAGGHRTDTETG